MSTSPTLPMIGPDGTPALIPHENVQAAANAGAKPAIKLYGPDGSPAYVPLANLGDALKAGAKTEGQFQQGNQGPSDSPKGFVQSLVAPIPQAAKGLYHAFTDEPTTPAEAAAKGTDPDSGLIARTLGQIGLGGYRTLVAPSIAAEKTAEGSVQSGHPLQAVSEAAEGIPLVGSGVTAGRQAISQYLSGDKSGAGGSVIGNLVAGGLGAATTGAVGSRLSPEATVAGQNYTPSHAAAFEGLTAKANGMGPNFIPQNLTPDALSPIRQTAADMLANGTPQEQAIAQNVTASGIKPLDRLGAVHSIIQKSLSDLESQHRPVLAQVAGTPVDMTPIQQGLAQQIKPGMSAADIAGIKDLIQRSGQITNLGDLNSFRQIMNEEASPSYRQTPTRAGQASAPQQVATDAANAVRSHYFDQMQQATGTDFQPLKNQESKLLTTKEAIERMQSPEAKAEATFNAPTTLKESLGNVANVIKDPRATVTQTMLRESPATRAAMLIRKSMTNLPDASPVQPSTSPALALLPAPIQRILALTRGNNE